jgi:class 3 adenylate cyclase
VPANWDTSGPGLWAGVLGHVGGGLRRVEGGSGRIRAGVHTGECEQRGDDSSGMGVHIGARVAAMAGAGEVLVTRTVRDLSAGSDLTFEDRGSHQLKGVPEQWHIFRVR